MRRLALLFVFLTFAAGCSSEGNPGSGGPENVPSSSSSTIVSTRPVTFGDFETVGDGESLSLLVDVCDVDLADVDIVETDEIITVAITEFFTPPTTNQLGEADIVDDCQGVVNVDLQQPFDGREVIDAATGESAQRS